MVAQVSLLAVNLTTVCIESFLYGIFFLLSGLSAYLLVIRHKSEATTRSIFLTPFFPGTLLIFTTVTGHWIVTFKRLFDAFIYFKSGKSPVSYFADVRLATEIVKTSFLVVTLFVGDSMIIYRLWVVWNYNWPIIIFPLCTLVGLAVCGIGINFQFSVYPLGENVFTSIAGNWITSDTVFTLATNIYCSSLIAWRIWSINSSTKQFGAASLNSVLAIIVESAAIYTTWTIFFISSYLSHSNIHSLAIDTIPVMAGISFMLIITRVGLGWAQKANIGTPTTTSGKTISQFNARPVDTILSDGIPMHPVTVNITKSVNRDDGYHTGSTTVFNESFGAKSEV